MLKNSHLRLLLQWLNKVKLDGGGQAAIFYPPRKIGNIVFSARGINLFSRAEFTNFLVIKLIIIKDGITNLETICSLCGNESVLFRNFLYEGIKEDGEYLVKYCRDYTYVGFSGSVCWYLYPALHITPTYKI